ncbi:MAG: dTDP-4-dehydrorhamnose 3,5-epimerase [Chitinivibrionales bacterium]|nr:dTDP-4-dehydrorhamnose 3,5-epimerase [Chitinivibrionales bacterium]MBD3394387.1 dTDP-4-dehydrorhamnose 3,5-epimerase [Chitinivibrionales bacterium]
MQVHQTELSGVLVLEPRVFGDHRGFFFESYSHREFTKHGIDITWVQDNHSLSRQKGVLRGLHFQRPPHTQTKLVRVVAGSVYDVVVDLRKDSRTFGTWQGFELSAREFKMLLVPKGFAHGFCTLEPDTEVLYKNDAFYEPSAEGGVRWNDPGLDIPWPVAQPIISGKDAALPLLKDLASPF